MADQFEVEGFTFDSEEMAQKARKEVEAIQYIREKTDLNNLELVRKLYDNLMRQQVFETVIGGTFLKELKDRLAESQEMQPQKEKSKKSESTQNRNRDVKKSRNEQVQKKNASRRAAEKHKRDTRLQISVTVNLLLIIVIAAMFFISTTSENITIVNYENKLIDKYEAWEQEIEEREQAVEEKEKELGLEP